MDYSQTGHWANQAVQKLELLTFTDTGEYGARLYIIWQFYRLLWQCHSCAEEKGAFRTCLALLTCSLSPSLSLPLSAHASGALWCQRLSKPAPSPLTHSPSSDCKLGSHSSLLLVFYQNLPPLHTVIVKLTQAKVLLVHLGPRNASYPLPFSPPTLYFHVTVLFNVHM